MLGVVALVATYAAIFLLYVLVPGRAVDGYARGSDGNVLRYRLNGLTVFALVLGGFVALARAGLVPWDLYWTERWTMLATAFVIGLVFTFAIVVPAPAVRSLAADLYLGRLENPQARGGAIDAKMFLYLIGATMLALNLVSFAAHHRLTFGADPSPGVTLHVALFCFFLVEYLWFERVHLYTYDFIAERVGFKLGWGCLVFYPFFYAVGLWAVADRPNPHAPTWLLVLATVMFFVGWSLARGANLQKFTFKTAPDRTHFLGMPQRVLGGRILVSGFWGVSRHVNYLGELLMASGLALSLGYPTALGPWLYPLYYVVLLVPRQIDDDRRCAQKYGPLWDEYRQAVRWRIVPWVY